MLVLVLLYNFLSVEFKVVGPEEPFLDFLEIRKYKIGQVNPIYYLDIERLNFNILF